MFVIVLTSNELVVFMSSRSRDKEKELRAL